MQTTKRNKEIVKNVNLEKEYTLSEAIALLKDQSKVKFVESLDCAIRLGVDPRHADQMVRGTVSLPHGTGKTVNVLVIAKGAKIQEALDAGADHAGFDDYLEKIKGGWADVDVIVDGRSCGCRPSTAAERRHDGLRGEAAVESEDFLGRVHGESLGAGCELM